MIEFILVMPLPLSGAKASRYVQTSYEILAVVLAVAWFAFIGFVLLRGAYEIGSLFIIFTVFIIGLAIANERPN